MTESIGTARLDIVVDTSNFDAGVTKAKRSTQDLATAAQQAQGSIEAGTKRQVAALERQIATLGKSRDEIIRWRIEQQTSGKVAAELTAKLDAQVARLNSSNKAFNQFGLTAKQNAAAMRGLPAQLTDIATALGSGQRPLTVLLQQGGQLKDMFGGIVPAARALGGAVLGLINPYTLAAAAIVGIGAAWAKAEEEAFAFNRALILTGNQASVTTDQLRAMAAQVDATTTASESKASEVLAQVAATGKFTAEQMQLVTTAAINMEAATGRAVKTTVAEFASLAKDPLDAILKLNEAVGDGTNVTNFLTQAQVEAIEKFKAQGKEAEATRVAVEAYAAAINDRAPEVLQNLTLISGVFHDIKQIVGDTTSSVVGFFRDLDSTSRTFFQNYGKQVQGLAEAVERLGFVPGAGVLRFSVDSFAKNANRPDFSNVQGTPGSSPVVNSQAVRDRIKAEEEFARLSETNLSKREKLESEIAKIKELGLKAGKSQLEIDKEIANARARYAESLPKGRKARNNDRSVQNASDRFDDMVGRFRSELQGPLERAEQEHLRRMREIQQAARDGKRSHEDLTAALALEGQAYAKTSDEIKHRFEAEVAQLSGPIAQAQEAHEAALRRIEELKAQGIVTGEQYNAMLREEATAYREDMQAAERAADPIGALLSDMRTQVEMIGKSNAEQAISNELVRQGIDLSSDYAKAKIAEANAIQQAGEAQQRSIDLMDEFRSGASNALTDIVTGAKSAKEAFADFFDDLARRITQMIAEKWIEKAFGAMGSDGSGTQGGGWISAIASLFANANGNAFQNGNVMAFANGGVVGSPTLFPMRNGMGLMGEAGPEAIVPLHRGPDGKLGIRMERESPSRQVTVQQSIYVTGTVSPYAASQMQQEAARKQRIVTSRNG